MGLLRRNDTITYARYSTRSSTRAVAHGPLSTSTIRAYTIDYTQQNALPWRASLHATIRAPFRSSVLATHTRVHGEAVRKDEGANADCADERRSELRVLARCESLRRRRPTRTVVSASSAAQRNAWKWA